MRGTYHIPWGCLSKSNETLIRNHQNLMQSEGHQALTDFFSTTWHRASQQKCWTRSECPALVLSEHQTATSAPAEWHSAEWSPQTAVPAAESLPDSPSHSPPAHVQQMPEAAARCRQRAGSPPRPDPGCHQGQSPTDQAAMAWADYLRASQSSPLREKQLQKHQTIHQNPQKIQW